jgi:hypothetical protein
MNHQAEVTLDWADGTYTFRLSVKGIIELEEKCGAPFGQIFTRLTTGLFAVNDVVETIRIGLIGGGMKPTEAKKLIDRYAMPVGDNQHLARAIIMGAMFGFEVSPLGNQKAATETESPNASTPPPLQRTPSRSASSPMSLDDIPFGNWPLQ